MSYHVPFLKISMQCVLSLCLLFTSCNRDSVPIFSVPDFPRYYEIDLKVKSQSCQFNAFHLQSQKMTGELTQSGDYYYFTLSSEQATIKLIGEMCLDQQDQPSYLCMRSKSRIRYNELSQVCEAQLRMPLEELPSSSSSTRAQSIRKPLSCCNENINDDNGIYLDIMREETMPDATNALVLDQGTDMSMDQGMIDELILDQGIKQPKAKIIGLKATFNAGLFLNMYLDNATVSKDCASQYYCELLLSIEATEKK